MRPQSCLPLCDHMDGSTPGSSVHGILQARILEWVAISYSRGSSRPRDKPVSLMFLVLAGRLVTIVPPGKPGQAEEMEIMLVTGCMWWWECVDALFALILSLKLEAKLLSEIECRGETVGDMKR